MLHCLRKLELGLGLVMLAIIIQVLMAIQLVFKLIIYLVQILKP